MNFTGIVIGLATFLIIGCFHPIVIKAEYHFSKRCWWFFLIAGIAFAALSLVVGNVIGSTVAGVLAFSCFWSILELFEQENRVKKGWFPKKGQEKYDFDEIVPRRGTNSYKWDSAANADIIPLWVADMDFRTAPAVTEALKKRVEHGIFGYTRVPDEYYDAVIEWFSRRHGLHIRKEWIIYTSGVVPAVSAVIKALTVPGDKVLIQTPVYNCFFSSIRNNGCGTVASPLRRTGNTFEIDFDDFEAKASDPDVKVFLLCSPHNPVGRVWTRDELVKMGEICIRNGVIVISDEIHCELVYPGHKHVPFASISPEFAARSVTCVSPSKAFNIAGLQIADIVAADPEIREKIDKAININEVCDVNPFGVIATVAAYGKGEPWLEQLLDYIRGNYDFMVRFCAEKLPEFPIAELQGTYLAWMDCSVLGEKSEIMEEELMKNAGIWLNAGTMYGAEGEGWLRWNLACPRARLEEALDRFLSFARGRLSGTR